MLNEKALAAQAWADLEVSADATGELEVARVSLPIDKVRALVAERRAALPSSPVSELSDEQIVGGLVERLRDVVGFIQKEHGRVAASACLAIEAATTLTALAADKARLEGEVEMLRAEITTLRVREAGPFEDRMKAKTTLYYAPDVAPKGARIMVDGLHLTEYEIQVLIGCTISGCNMSPDRVFSLPMAWHRLHALGLIDRTDGLAIVTEAGKATVDRIRSTLSDAVAEREAELVAWEWAAFEDGVQQGNWKPYGYGDEAGWAAIAKRNPDKYQVRYRPLYTSPPTSELEALRKRVAELEKEREEDLAAREAELEVSFDNGHYRAMSEHATPQRLRAERAEARVAELEKALEPFARHIDEMKFDIDNKGNPLPDDQAVGCVYVTNGDFRTARRVREGGKVDG